MAYNGGFPMTYQPLYQPYQQPVMPTIQPQQQTAPQMMTLPTIHADIIQVSSEQEAANANVAAGASQMMIAKDDSAIYVKTAFPNGQYRLDVFEKRPPAPPTPAFDATAYVTKDELETRLEAILAAVKPDKGGKEK